VNEAKTGRVQWESQLVVKIVVINDNLNQKKQDILKTSDVQNQAKKLLHAKQIYAFK